MSYRMRLSFAVWAPHANVGRSDQIHCEANVSDVRDTEMNQSLLTTQTQMETKSVYT